jgi:hypothetical protein
VLIVVVVLCTKSLHERMHFASQNVCDCCSILGTRNCCHNICPLYYVTSNIRTIITLSFVPYAVNRFATRLIILPPLNSIASLSETNLKKQGMLPLTFSNPDDYEKVGEADRVSLVGLSDLTPGKVRTVLLLLHT